MRLDNIKLNNFGIYHDKVNLDLSINNNNIILIGGENGAGKTTLLNAIKICLYGSISMGYKTNTEDYLDYIKDFYNYSAENNNHNKMSINLKLLLNYKGNKIPFELKRSWDPDNDFKESFFVKDLSENKVIPSADFEDYFNNVFPPSLFDFFIFDGELVNDMLYKKEFNVIFKKAVKTILNLNLPETIINDLEKIQKNKINNNFSKIENEYTEIKFEYQSIKSEITEMKSNLENINKKIKNLISEKNKLEKLFNDKGGIHANKRQKLKNQIKELEDRKSKAKNKVDNLADTHLPFFINKDMLNIIKNQLDAESGFKTYHEFQNNINNQHIKKMKKKLKDQGYFIKNEEKSKNLNKAINMIIDDIKNIFKPNNIDENFEPIHLLSYPEEERLKNIINNIMNYDIENIINEINLIDKIQNDISKLNKKLKLNKENTDLKDILNKIEEKNIEIGRLKEKKENIEEKITKQEENLEKISNDKENMYNELKNIKKEINIPLICEKIDSVLNQFIHIQLKEKIAILEEKFLDIINKLISIENYIDDINIDINDFSITIYGANNQKLNNLSSGEQELVILSLLWSLSELSKREYPLVFDTLLGRIDEKHRNNIIEFLLAKSKRQIIILSTDSEIDQNHYNKIAPYIERDYLIFKKDKINHKSIIEENFFYEKEKVI